MPLSKVKQQIYNLVSKGSSEYAGVQTNDDEGYFILGNNENNSSQGNAIILWGKDHTSASHGGDIHYITDNRGTSGRHKFYRWNGTGWLNKVTIDDNGIQFDGQSGAAHSLDDYEEGSFDPYFYGTTTAGTWTANAEGKGFYVKVGRMVQCWMNVRGTLSGAAGAMYIGGLPFTSAASASAADGQNAVYSSGSIQYWAGPSVQANGPLTPPNGTAAYFHSYATNSTAGAQVSVANVSHNCHCFLCYYTA